MAKWTVYLEGGPRRVNHAAVALGSKIYSFGGYCSGDLHDSKQTLDIHVLDTDSYRWSKVTHSNLTCPTQSNDFMDTSDYINIEQDRYRADKSDVPCQRYGHTVVGYNGKAYVWGGRNDDFGATNDLHEFDPETCFWKRVQVNGMTPLARDGHTAVVVDDKMVIFGGFEEDMQRFSQETYIFDFTKNKWTEFETKNEPPMWRDFHTAAIIKNVMYIFGGRSDQSGQVGDEHLFHSSIDVYDNSLMSLNLETGEWKKVETEGIAPSGRRSHSAWVYKDKMYMFGGYLGTKNVHYNDLFCFDPDTNKWTIVEVSGTYPSPRRRHCTVVLNDKVFLFGGTMPVSKNCTSNAVISLMNPGLADLSDLHVLDYSPSLKQLALLKVINSGIPNSKMYNCMKNELPFDIRHEMYFMTAPNQVNNSLPTRHESSG